jgi:hypothetical protein
MKNSEIMKENGMNSDHTKESAIAINHRNFFKIKKGKDTGLYGGALLRA